MWESFILGAGSSVLIRSRVAKNDVVAVGGRRWLDRVVKRGAVLHQMESCCTRVAESLAGLVSGAAA